MRRLENKAAVIIGANGGIRPAIAIRVDRLVHRESLAVGGGKTRRL